MIRRTLALGALLAALTAVAPATAPAGFFDGDHAVTGPALPR